MISFSVDTQGEADDLVQQLFDDNLIADVNFLSAMVNRKFSLYGQVTSDPSQVRVEIVTSDSKASAVMTKITSWKASAGKSTGGADNDVVVTPLSGGSGEYISFVLKQTNGKSESGSSSSSTPGLLMASQKEAPESDDSLLTTPSSPSVDESAQL